MKPVDQFLQSVREGFSKNQAGDWTQLILLLLAAVSVTVAVSMWIGRWRKRRAEERHTEAVAAHAGLRQADRDHLTRIATADGTTLLEVMTVLATFERATALALATENRVPHPAEGSAFDRVRRLRKALGFSPLPAHHWLLSTRELIAGDRIAVAGASTTVADINEASLAVDLPLRAAHTQAPGTVASVTIVRADDSRYLARVRILTTEPVPASTTDAGGGEALRRVFFAHDEQPERQQNREHVRVRVRGPVTVRIVTKVKKPPGTGAAAGDATEGADDQDEAAVRAGALHAGTLADISAGGLSLDLPVSADGPIPRGARLRCTFTLEEGVAFEMLAAVVSDAGAGPGAGKQHIRASFTALAEAERDRLAASVTRLQRKPSSDGSPPT